MDEDIVDLMKGACQSSWANSSAIGLFNAAIAEIERLRAAAVGADVGADETGAEKSADTSID